MQEGTPGALPVRRRPLSIDITVRTMLVAAAIIAVGWAFIAVRTSVLTLFLALFSALVLDPVVELAQRRLKLGRSTAAVVVVLGTVALALVVVFILLSPFASATRDFVNALPTLVQDIRDSSVGSWIDAHSQAPEQSQEHVKQVAKAIGQAAGGVLGVGISGFSLVLSLVTAIFLTLFLIIDMPRLVAGVDSLLDPAGSARLQRIWPAIVTAVSRTMLGNIAISVVCGTIYGLSAWALGLPFPLALAFIAGFLDLIPMVGATIAGVILVLAALTQGVTAAVIMLAIVLVYQQIENYVLQPTILGKAADVSGFLVIASVLVFGTLLGAVGAIIAVPIVASIQIVVRELTAKRRSEMAELRAADEGANVATIP
ncbi:MAG TPA: AI-2E family transporter [Gaiellaceae bacterium]|nr:AI-2E family transporter [Gaiellaceae bacterium]